MAFLFREVLTNAMAIPAIARRMAEVFDPQRHP